MRARWGVLAGAGVAAVVAVVARFHARPVVTVAVSREDVVEHALGTGALEAVDTAVIAFTVPGRLRAVVVDEGDRVTAGQVLATLDPDDLDGRARAARANERVAGEGRARAAAEVAGAKVAVDAAARDARRAELLAQTAALSPTAFDSASERLGRAEAALHGAEAAFAQAGASVAAARSAAAVEERRREEAVVKCPFDGVVSHRARVSGEVAPAGAEVVTIASQRIRARAWLDERALEALTPGTPATVTARSSPNTPLAAHVERAPAEAERSSHELRVDLAFDAPPRRWVLGQQVDVAIPVARRRAVLALPPGVCRRGADRDAGTCFVVRGGTARAVAVRFGLRGDERVEIVSGLAEGDRVVAEGDDLFDGARVKERP